MLALVESEQEWPDETGCSMRNGHLNRSRTRALVAGLLFCLASLCVLIVIRVSVAGASSRLDRYSRAFNIVFPGIERGRDGDGNPPMRAIDQETNPKVDVETDDGWSPVYWNRDPPLIQTVKASRFKVNEAIKLRTEEYGSDESSGQRSEKGSVQLLKDSHKAEAEIPGNSSYIDAEQLLWEDCSFDIDRHDRNRYGRQFDLSPLPSKEVRFRGTHSNRRKLIDFNVPNIDLPHLPFFSSSSDPPSNSPFPVVAPEQSIADSYIPTPAPPQNSALEAAPSESPEIGAPLAGSDRPPGSAVLSMPPSFLMSVSSFTPATIGPTAGAQRESNSNFSVVAIAVVVTTVVTLAVAAIAFYFYRKLRSAAEIEENSDKSKDHKPLLDYTTQSNQFFWKSNEAPHNGSGSLSFARSRLQEGPTLDVNKSATPVEKKGPGYGNREGKDGDRTVSGIPINIIIDSQRSLSLPASLTKELKVTRLSSISKITKTKTASTPTSSTANSAPETSTVAVDLSAGPLPLPLPSIDSFESSVASLLPTAAPFSVPMMLAQSLPLSSSVSSHVARPQPSVSAASLLDPSLPQSLSVSHSEPLAASLQSSAPSPPLPSLAVIVTSSSQLPPSPPPLPPACALTPSPAPPQHPVDCRLGPATANPLPPPSLPLVPSIATPTYCAPIPPPPLPTVASASGFAAIAASEASTPPVTATAALHSVGFTPGHSLHNVGPQHPSLPSFSKGKGPPAAPLPPGGKGPPASSPPTANIALPPAPPFRPSVPPLQPTSTGRTNAGKTHNVNDLPKLKPLHWDKVRADPSQSMVWDKLRAGSFILDEEIIETLFGYNSKATSKAEIKKPTTVPMLGKKHGILDARKAHNIAIQLRALNLSKDDICNSLLEGDGLSSEILEVLVKMAPGQEEQKQLRNFNGDPSQLGPAEHFLMALLEVPLTFERLKAMLFKACFKEDLLQVQESLQILEVACKEVSSSRLFLKLLEAVLKTGNRMNAGTFRGDAEAFKLDTLLKLSDIKSANGKTSLLHFVVEEIIKAEGVRAVRMSEAGSSEVQTTEKSDDEYKRIGLQVIMGLNSELRSVKMAATIEADALTLSVSKLVNGLSFIKVMVETQFEVQNAGNFSVADVFLLNMSSFVRQAEEDVNYVQKELSRVFDKVREATAYFHGSSRETQPMHMFMIVSDFLRLLEKVCTDLGKTFKVKIHG